MKYPKHDIYEALYAKYLDPESLNILMDCFGKDLTGKRMIDICCGGGICTEEALSRNIKHVLMIDSEKDMVPDRFKRQNKTDVIISTVEHSFGNLFQEYFQGYKFDIAVCRQAINYWFNNKLIENLATMINDRGIFAFNTFNTRPSESPRIKQYHHKNVSFTEISYISSHDMVHHIQIRDGYPPHMATFKWISPEEFNSILSLYFEIEKITRNRTDYYRCIKK